MLEQALDESQPLLERVKYCAFFSSHLDEFFGVRVAGLLDQAASGLNVRSEDGRTPRAALAEIRKRVEALNERQTRLWSHDLCPALAREGIVVTGVAELTEEELVELAARFEQEVYPVLTPLAVGPGQPFPYISALSLSLAVFVRDPDTGEERLARVKVPEGLPRFMEVGARGVFVPLEDVIAHFLGSLFPQMELSEPTVFRVTRDADFEVSDEADDLLEAVQIELRRRRFGDIVRVEVSAPAAPAMLERLKRGLAVADEQIYVVDGLLDLADAMEIARLDRPELKDDPWVPVTHRRFMSGPSVMFSEIAKADILVHHPYESFATSFEAFVRTAAGDPDVIALKATVYRTSDETPLVPALAEAAENGKQSVCLVELKARFDERRNIEWSQSLERAGVHVVYGFPEPEDPREGDARRAPGSRWAEALRPHRHRQLSLGHGAGLRGLRPLHRRSRDRPGRREPLQLRDRLRTARAVPQAARGAVQPPRPADRGDPKGRRVCRRAEEGANQDQGQQPQRPGDHRRALSRLAGWCEDRPDRPQRLCAAARREGVVGEHPRS